MIRALRRHATPIYIGSVVVLTLCFTALALALAWDAGVRHQAMLAVLGLLALFPLSELSIQIVNALVISLLPPDPLPKMEFERGYSARARHAGSRPDDAVERGSGAA